MAKFKTIITTVGAAKIAAVLAGTGSIVLDNTAKMAVGDGSGTLPTPNPAQTKLVNEVHRASINKASIDASDQKNIIAELVIPPETGGFWLREMALYDAAGTLLAVGNMAETYKPSLSEGAGRKMVIRMVIAVSEVSAVTITMDTSTVMATQDYVDTEIDKHAKSRNHPDATLTAKGFTQLNSATNSASETQAATPKAVKTVMDATSLKAPLASPALSGVPTAPTAPPGTNSQQLANTQFVLAAIASLINSAPGVLDTLGELAAALGNDANFAATMTAALAAKAPLASPALSGLPTAPTAAPGTSTLQLANTAFVMTAVASLVNSSPAALDTLKELADALGNDANFATTMTNALAGKQPKDTTLTNISGKDVAGLLQYLGLNNVIRVGNFGIGIKNETQPGQMAALNVTKFDYFKPSDNIGPLPGYWCGGLSYAMGDDIGWQMAGLGQVNTGEKPRLFIRTKNKDLTFTNWGEIYHSLNKPSADDVGALPVDGNAKSATKLANPRAINGRNFDGTASITLTGDDIYPDSIMAKPGRSIGIAAKESNRTYISNEIAAMNAGVRLVGYQVAEWYADNCFWGAVRSSTTTLQAWTVFYNGFPQFSVDLQTGDISSGRQGILATQNWSNQRFVQGFRDGAEIISTLNIPGTNQEATFNAPAGSSITALTSYSTGNYTSITKVGYRPKQININGSWLNVGA